MFKVKQSSHYIAYIVTQRFFDRCFSLEIPIVLIIFSSTFLPFGQEAFQRSRSFQMFFSIISEKQRVLNLTKIVLSTKGNLLFSDRHLE